MTGHLLQMSFSLLLNVRSHLYIPLNIKIHIYMPLNKLYNYMFFKTTVYTYISRDLAFAFIISIYKLFLSYALTTISKYY